MNQRLVHPGADPACPKCHQLGLRVVRKGLLACAVPCECVGQCPVCRGTGWTSTGDGFRAPRRRCICQHVRARGRVFDDVRLPGRYAEATLASFAPARGTRAAFTAANRYVSNFALHEPNRGLVLHGLVGRGKTHLMIGVLRELVLRYGVTARFVEFSHLLGDLKMSYGKQNATAELLEPLSKVEVLAIDELGKGRNTDWEGSVLDELVSRRYNSFGTILATTNYPPGAKTGNATPNLADGKMETNPLLPDRVGDRVYSRLREICDFVELKGEDFRETSRRDRRSAGRA